MNGVDDEKRAGRSLTRLVQRVRDGLERGRAPTRRRTSTQRDRSPARPYLEPLEPRILLSADVGLVPDALLAPPADDFDPRLILEPEIHDEVLVREPSRFDEVLETYDRLEDASLNLAEEALGTSDATTGNPTEIDLESAGRALASAIWSGDLEDTTEEGRRAEQIVLFDARVPEVASLLEALLEGTAQGDEGGGGETKGATDGDRLDAKTDRATRSAEDGDVRDTSETSPAERATFLAEALEARGIEVIVLDAERDGLDQLGEIARAYQGVGAIHVVSHGSQGSLTLGLSRVTTETLRSRAASLADLRQTLGPEGDLLLYGCEVANGQAGIEFVSTLAELAGVDVAASSDLTGATSQNGDWDLEFSTGEIEAAALRADGFDGLLLAFELADPSAIPALDTHLTLGFTPPPAPDMNGSWVLTSDRLLIQDGDPTTANTSFTFEEDTLISITTAGGADSLEILSADETFTGTIELNAGEGDDDLRVRGQGALATPFAGTIELHGGAGIDTLGVELGALSGFAGTLRLDGGDDDDVLTFSGFSEASASASSTLSGGAGDDRYVFADGAEHVGSLTIEEADAAGQDTVVYPAGFDGFASGTLTFDSEANVETIDLALSDATLASLRQGLADLADWASRLQTGGDLGAALAGIRGNVDVGVGTALDLGQAFDQLRIQVESTIASGATAEDLRDVFEGFARTGIAHDDRSLFGSVVGEGFTASGSFGLSITLDDGATFRFGLAATTGTTPLPLTFEVRLVGAAALTLRRETNGDATLRRSAGSWLADGFRVGQTLTLEAGVANVNRASGDFEIETISGDGRLVTLKLVEGADGNQDAFETILGDDDVYSTAGDSGSNAPIVRVANTVFRADGGRWNDDGFRIGQTVRVANQDWLGAEGREIKEISDDGRVLILDGAVTAQTPGTAATLTGVPIAAPLDSIVDLVASLNEAIAESDLDGRIEAMATDLAADGSPTGTTRLGFKVLDPEVDTLALELTATAANAADLDALGFSGERTSEGLSTELKGLGDLSVAVLGAVDLSVDEENGVLSIDFRYSATRTSEFNLGLGQAADDKGIAPDSTISIAMDSALEAELSFAVPLGEPGSFEVSVGSLRTTASIVDAEIANGTTIDIGFLGAQVGDDHDDLSSGVGHLSLAAELELGTSWASVDLDEEGTALETRAADLSRAAGGNQFQLELPLVVKPGLDVVGSPDSFRADDLLISTGATVRSESPFEGAEALLDTTGDSAFRNFEQVEAFARIDAQKMLRLLAEIRTGLQRVGESELVSQFDIPFVSDGLDRVLDLADAFGDALLYDDGDDGIDRDDDTFLVTDLNRALRDAGLADFVEFRIVDIPNTDDRTFEIFAIDPSVTGIAITIATGDTFFGFASNPVPATGRDPEIAAPTAIDPNLFVLAADQVATIAVTRTGGSESGVVRVDREDTTDNKKVGNDVAKLLDANNAPTFKTAQELKARLAEILLAALDDDLLEFDSATNILSYEIDLTNELFSEAFSVDFDLDLGPLGDIETVGNPKITIGGEVGFNMRFGIDLSSTPNGQAGIDDDTLLTDLRGIDELRDLILSNPAITAGNTPGATTVDDENVEITIDRLRLSNHPDLIFDASEALDVSADTLVNDLVYLTAPDGFTIVVLDGRGMSSGDLQQQSLQVPARAPATTNADGLLVYEAPALDFELRLDPVNGPRGEFFSVALAAQTFTVSSDRVFKSRWLEAIERAISEAQSSGASNSILREDGLDWASDGFAIGQIIEITGSDSNDGRYEIEALDGSRLSLVQDLVASARDAAGTLVAEADIQIEGPGFVRTDDPNAFDGFEAGDLIQIAGSRENDGSYVIDSRSVQGGVTTLIVAVALEPEAASNTVVVADTGASVRLDPDASDASEADARFVIELGSHRYQIVLAAEADPDDAFAPNTADNTNQMDLVHDLRAALARAKDLADPTGDDVDLRDRVSVSLDGTRLVLTLATGELAENVALSFAPTPSTGLRATGILTRAGEDDGDDAGSWSDDGFAAGDLIRVVDSEDNDGLYRILRLDSDTEIAVERLDSTTSIVVSSEENDVDVRGAIPAFHDPDVSLAITGNEITRSTGSFQDDGFVAGQLLVIERAGENDGTYRIASVTDTQLFLDDLDGTAASLATELSRAGALFSASFRISELSAGARALGFGHPDGTPNANEQDANLHDLVVQARNGDEFRVSLDGATTIGDVLRRIEEAAVDSGIAAPDRIRARVAEDGTGIELVERGQLTGSPRLTFEERTGEGRILRSEGDWTDDGFVVGNPITVTGSARNDGTYEIIRIERANPTDTDGPFVALIIASEVLKNESFVRDADVTTLGFQDGNESFHVERINGSAAAVGLGILRADGERDSNEDGRVDALDGDGLIEGSAIGGSSIFDRIFIENPELTASLFIQPSTTAGIDITGRFGFFEATLNANGNLFSEASITLNDPGEGAAQDGKITLREIATGLQNIRDFIEVPQFGGNALDDRAGQILFSNDSIGGVLTRQSGDWAEDDFAIHQRITIRNAAGRDGDYTVRSVEGQILRLDETLPAGDSPAAIPADGDLSVIAAIGTLRLELSQIDLGEFASIGPEAAIVVTLFDFGDPFFRPVVGAESKAGGSVSFEAVDQIRVTRGSGSEKVDETLTDLREALTAREELKLEIHYTDADGQRHTASEKISQIDADGRIHVEDDLVTNTTGLTITKVSFSKPPRTDIQTPDLGNLLDWENISIRDIIRGLQLASDFLSQFEEFGFLDDPIPVINTSFNDLLAYADEFAIAVEEIARDPDGSLQTLEARLEEILGIDDGTDTAAGQDPFDIELIYATEELTGASLGETRSILRIDLILGSEWRESLGVEFDLGGGDNDLLAGSAGLAASAAAEIRIALGIDISETRMRGNPALVFRQNDGDENDEIERLDGESWLGDGFLPGQTIQIKGSAFNDDLYTILGFTNGGRTLVLRDALAASEGVEGVGVAGLEVTGSRAISLFDDTAITARFDAGAEDVSFRAAVGPLGIFVSEGEVDLGGRIGADPNAPSADPLNFFRAGLDFDQPGDDGSAPIFASGTSGSGHDPHRRQLAGTVVENLSDTFSAQLEGGLDVSLPVFFPSDSIERGSVEYSVGFLLDSENGLATTGAGIEFFKVGETGPVEFGELFDLSGLLDLGQLSLFDNILLAVDGFDLFLGGIQDVLDGEIFGIELPLIGDSLADGARFIEDLRNDFVEPFRDAVEDAETFVDDQENPDRNIVSKLLFDLLAPTGLLLVTRDADGNALADDDVFTARAANLVTDLDAVLEAGQFFLRQVIDLDGTRRNDAGSYFEADGSVVTEGEIDIAQIPSENIQEIAFLEWDFRLGQSLAAVDADIALDFGLPALGLEADGAIGLELGWDLELGFGLDFANGFYFDIGSASELEVEIDVVLPDSLTGRLAFLQLDAINAGSGLGATFVVDVVNETDAGDDKLSFGELGKLKLETGLAAEARALLDLQLKLNDELLADFASVFPTVMADFEFDWGIGSRGDVTLGFLASAGGMGTLTRSDANGSFANDGYMTDQIIRVSGTTGGANDGAYKILEVHDDRLVVELRQSQTFVALAGQSDVTILLDLSSLSGSVLSDGLRLVEFRNVGLDLGSFISDFIQPVLGEIQKVTGPIQPVIDILTTPLPVLSDLGPPTTILDLARLTGAFDPAFIESIADIITLVNAIPTNVSNLVIPFGDFTIYDRSDPAMMAVDPTDPDADLSGMNERAAGDGRSIDAKLDEQAAADPSKRESTSFVKKLKNTKGFQFPILTDPSQIFGLLTGEEITLFGYDMPPLDFDFSVTAFFPLFGPLGIGLTGSGNAHIDFAFGFDSSGLTRFFDSDFENPALIFDGFFVSDNPEDVTGAGPDLPELILGAGIGLSAELNLGIARAGVQGALELDLFFDLFDPNRDGKIRVGEILENIENEFQFGTPALAPLAIFDLSGVLTARAFAFLKVNLLFFSIDTEFNITPPITLLDFDVEFKRAPKLATELDDGTLQLNMGEYAEQRLNGDLNDAAEHFRVASTGDGLRVTWVGSNGSGPDFTQVYKGNFTRILAKGGRGDDIIDVSGVDQAGIRFQLEGGLGNDRLDAGTLRTDVSAELRGGDGADALIGTGGDDLLFGDAGRDRILGGAGDDVIFADGGGLIESDARVRNIDLRLLAGDSTAGALIERLDEGSFVDDGFAVGQVLEISDRETGSEGIYRVASVDAGRLVLDATGVFAPVAGGPIPISGILETGSLEILAVDSEFLSAYQVLAGSDDGDDAVAGGLGDDWIFGAGGSDALIGGVIGASGDSVDAQLALLFDLLRGSATGAIDTSSDATGADILIGDGGRLRLLRDGTLREVADTDRGLAFGDDRLFGSGGEDRLYGGRGDDTLRGGDGNDELFGETGFDRLYGEADADRLFGGRDGDVLEGGDGDDWIEGQQGADLIRGGAGDDQIFGQAGTDTLFGEAGSDTLDGGSDADVLFGGDGNDQLDGGAGDDIVFGDRGGVDFDDVEATLSAGLVERLRRDAASFESELDVDAPTGAGADRITVRAGSDQVDGQAGSDRYTVGIRGAENSARIRVFDSGSNLSADIDSLTINGTAHDDQFLLRAATNPDALSFVASINRGTDVERIDYDDLEVLVVNGLFGDDRFALDDLRASATLNGGGGDDFFQIGQLYRSRRTARDANVAIEDEFTTTETTRGFLSNGVSAATTINGGNDNDEVIVFRNVAALQVNGQDGDDSVTVRAFALVNPEDKLQEETQISGGGGADTIRYAVNAPVNIDGGDGLDSVSVIGTEFADEFVITKDGVFGAGLNVNFVNVEYLRVDGAEGDDSFYIQSTNEAILTQVVGGLGSDTFQIADGVERAVTSNDLLGHSGLILHDVESNDPVYQGPEGLGIAANGISANVADADEPGIVISEMSGFTRIAEGGAFDWYTVVLTRRPEQEVRVRALAPNASPEEMARGERSFRVYSAANNQSDGSGTTLFFDADNWWMPQTVFVQADGAFDDAELEGERFGVIQHLVESEDTRTGLLDTVEGASRGADGTVFTEVVLESPLETDYDLVGRVLEIISAPAGEVTGGLGQSLLIESSEMIGNVTRLRLFGAFDPDDLPREGSEYRIRFYDGLQLPNVTVQIDDNDAADVILTEIEELRVFERSADQLGGIEAFASYEVTLSREPRNGETIFVDLEVTSANGEPDQIRLAQGSGSTTTPGTGTLRLTFSADANAPNAWNVPQVVTVSAIDDAAREGFHRGLIEHRVTTAAFADHDEIDLTTDAISLVDALGEPGTAAFVLLEALPVQFQGTVDEATANTISGFPSGAISLSELQRLLDGQDLSGLVVRITKGPGAGQVRHVASFGADGVVTLDRPWTTIPDETSRFSLSQMTVSVDGETLAPERYVVNGSTVVFLDAEGSVEERTASSVVVTYGTLDRGYEGRVEERLSIRVVDNDTAGVLVLESDGSTDVTEVNPNLDGRTTIADRYQVVLSRPPGLLDPLSRDPSFDPSNGPAFVEVIVEPGATLTSRGDLVRGERLVPDGPLVGETQLEVRASQTQAPGSHVDAQGRLVLVFTAANWNIPQTVEVVAKTDELVDGGDTKVFAPRPSTLIDIQGPLLIDGAGGSGSLEGLTPAVLLPNADPALRETNVKTPTGDVLEATSTSLTIDTASLAAYLVERGLSNPEGLVGRTIEIVRGPGLDQFREILAVTTLGDATRIDVAPAWNLEAADLSEVSAYKITNQSLNFFVDESAQNDLAFVHDEDSPADSRGRLTELDYALFPEMVEFFNDQLEPGDPGFITPDRLVGFGMGPDTDIARGLRPGGITYSNFEGFELDLGYGHNELTIDSVHERDDAVQTFTRVRTGRGDDTVLVALDRPDDAASGLPWVEVDTGAGDDRVDASASFLGLQIVGGLGNDHLIGGEGDDVIHGDFGSLDFAVLDRAAVRQTIVESLRVGEGGNDVLAGRGGDDRLFGGAGHDVVSGEDDSDILFGDYGRVTTFDAVHRTAETTAIFQGGLDILIGGRGNDFLFGGAGGDVLDGDFDHDLIVGEYARLMLENGVATSIVRFAQGDQDLAASAFFDLYSPQFAPITPFAQAALAPEGARFPDPALRASAAPTPLRRMSSGTDPNPSEEHRVVRGETLWGLAERHLGDPYRWPEIYALNRATISDPDRLDVGQEIELPREAIGAQPLESSDVELAALAALLEELDARSAAEARAGWGFTNPLAVGSGPPAERPVPSTQETSPETSRETPSDSQGNSERQLDDGAARPAESSGDPDLSSAIWASLLGWRATSTQANVQARGRWRRFDEHTGRFA